MGKPITDEGNWLYVLVRGMKFNLIWYIPLSAWVLLYFVVPNFNSGLENIRLVFHRFSWSLFFSPAAALFFSAIVASLFVPFQLLLVIPGFFAAESIGCIKRYVWSLGVVVAIFVTAILLQAVIWGSFPLPVDKDGYIHVRLIPFIPWPDIPLLQSP
jgi:hypothetical protein